MNLLLTNDPADRVARCEKDRVGRQYLLTLVPDLPCSFLGEWSVQRPIVTAMETSLSVDHACNEVSIRRVESTAEGKSDSDAKVRKKTNDLSDCAFPHKYDSQ